MRGFATGTLAIALGFGMVASVAADEDSDKSGAMPARNPIGFHWSPMFAHAVGLDQEKPAPKKPAAKPKPKKEAAPSPKPAPVVDQTSALRAREEATLLRRLAVCDKLKEIAIRTNDSDLLTRVEALDERARMTYAQHTAQLKAGASGMDLDEQILDQHLGSATSARRSQDQDVAVTANAEGRGGRATAREEKR